MMSDKKIDEVAKFKDLPDIISDIHLGFANGRNYIGKVDVDYCLEIEISITENEMTIKAVFPDKLGNIVVEKHYKRCPFRAWRAVEK